MTAATITRLEQALDQSLAELRLVEGWADDATIIAACDRVGDIVIDIEARPLETLGDLRLAAKMLRRWPDGCALLDGAERLLAALERLPARLWDETI